MTWRCLVRYLALFVIDSKSRPGEIAGITATSCEEWKRRIDRSLIDCEDGFLLNSHHLIHDRDPLLSHAFAGTLKRDGVNPAKLPIRCPNPNAYPERFVRSAKSEYIGQVIPIGERHFRLVVGEYVEHDQRERNHQGIGDRLVGSDFCALRMAGPVECHERLGVMLAYSARDAL